MPKAEQRSDTYQDRRQTSANYPAWSRYCGAIVAVVLLTLLRLALDPWLGSHHPFLTLLLAVMLSSWYGGLGPGLLATFLGTSASWYLFGDPRYTFILDSTDDYVGVGLSLIMGVAVSALNETRIRSHFLTSTYLQQANEANERLRQETVERLLQQEALRESQQQLFHAQKMESVGRLAGGVAHDFNNLLTAILGYAELAEESLAQEAEEQAYILGIQQAGQRAAELITQLLTYARRQVMTLKIVNLNAIFTEVEPLMRRILSADIGLVIMPANDLWNVRADTGQLLQILLNLGMNARDAMKHGGILVMEVGNVTLNSEVTGHNAALPPGKYVLLSVRDTGMGMAPEVQEHIFEPFFTTKELGKGTGLGLAICESLVKQFQGHIRVVSEPGKGANFQIYLPQVQDALGETEVTAVRLPEDKTPGGSETILLVEDEPMIRAIAAQALRAQGYHVLAAANGMDALKIHTEYQEGIDLLITDVVMSWMNGKELADRIQARRPNIRILFISGYTNNVLMHNGVMLHGVTLFQKPFTSSALRQKVRQVLDTSMGSDNRHLHANSLLRRVPPDPQKKGFLVEAQELSALSP